MGEPFTIETARNIAERAHEGQTDKAGVAYIHHPAAVASALAEHGELAVMAGWLHDVIEDTDVSLADLETAGCPPDVLRAVDSVTRREGEIYMDLIRRAAADPLGRLVKLADNAHNSSEERLAVLPAEQAAGLRKRYARARAVLAARA